MPTAEKSTPYPSITLQNIQPFIKKISDMHLPSISLETLAQECGITNPGTKSFQRKISTAKQFGLITLSNGAVCLTDRANKIIHPISDDIKPLLFECFMQSALYRDIITEFGGKPIPRQDLFENILVDRYKITNSAKRMAAGCFITCAEDLGLLIGGILHTDLVEEPRNRPLSPSAAQVETRVEEPNLTSPSRAPEETSDTPNVIFQRIPISSGGAVEISIPVDATNDDLLLVKDMFEVILRRKFNTPKEVINE